MQRQQWKRAVVAAASLLMAVVAVCCYARQGASSNSGGSPATLLQMLNWGIAGGSAKYADRLYGEKIAVQEALARIGSLRGAARQSRNHDGGLKADSGTGGQGLPKGFILDGQQLAGWKAEQAELNSLEKKAEERLKKDVAAADTGRSKAGSDVMLGYNATGGKIKVLSLWLQATFACDACWTGG
jgi:hypothetical protein